MYHARTVRNCAGGTVNVVGNGQHDCVTEPAPRFPLRLSRVSRGESTNKGPFRVLTVVAPRSILAGEETLKAAFGVEEFGAARGLEPYIEVKITNEIRTTARINRDGIAREAGDFGDFSDGVPAFTFEMKRERRESSHGAELT